jgi:hypothetical protein
LCATPKIAERCRCHASVHFSREPLVGLLTRALNDGARPADLVLAHFLLAFFPVGNSVTPAVRRKINDAGCHDEPSMNLAIAAAGMARVQGEHRHNAPVPFTPDDGEAMEPVVDPQRNGGLAPHPQQTATIACVGLHVRMVDDRLQQGRADATLLASPIGMSTQENHDFASQVLSSPETVASV